LSRDGPWPESSDRPRRTDTVTDLDTSSRLWPTTTTTRHQQERRGAVEQWAGAGAVGERVRWEGEKRGSYVECAAVRATVVKQRVY
jgi:hypothetical protein